MSVEGFLLGALYGTTGAHLAALFEAHVRCSGISLAYQSAGLLGGAPAPIISTFLIHWSQGRTWSVAAYLAASSLITLAAVYAVRHRRHAASATI
jgi:MFS transporter, MHS family, shikimate and dehydroshikimate transport protein